MKVNKVTRYICFEAHLLQPFLLLYFLVYKKKNDYVHYNYNMQTAHCKMQTIHCTARCTLKTSYCTLHTKHNTKFPAQCTLHTALCTLHTAKYTLNTKHKTLNTAISYSVIQWLNKGIFNILPPMWFGLCGLGGPPLLIWLSFLSFSHIYFFLTTRSLKVN